MIAVSRFVRYFLDSPTYGRDRATLISGASIGFASLLLNGAVLMLFLPLVLAPLDFRITDDLEFGQLLAMTLLGGATAFATLFIPLRLATVFWEPRTGKYFDQIVLSGISPLRFVIGKAASQNLFLGLVLFLLLPYMVFSMTLGGVDLGYFVAGLFLVWLYCMELAVMTLWLSLYLNEALAACLVILAAPILMSYGVVPQQFQLFVMTPFPVLMHPIFATIARFNGVTQQDFFLVFCSSAVCMTTFISIALIAIFLGPLYGIIRENSTFGEVVREGDAKSKRWFRFRMHIQRSSEIAFFYENRSHSFLRSEGLFRWGAALCGLLLLSSTSFAGLAYFASKELPLLPPPSIHWAVFVFHRTDLMIHGIGLALAAILFSHTKNTTYQRLPFFRGRTSEVSRLDTIAFLLFATFSTTASIAAPFLFERYVAVPRGMTIFPAGFSVSFPQASPITFIHIAIEGTIVITVAGLVVYTFQRLACLSTWSRSVTCVSVGAVYSVFFCTLPIFFAMLCLDVPDLRSIRILADSAPTLAASSPIAVMFILFNGQIGPMFSKDVSTAPFFITHVALFCLMLLGIRRGARKLRRMYLTEPTGKTVDG